MSRAMLNGPAGGPFFEQLEPRLLLSSDGIAAMAGQLNTNPITHYEPFASVALQESASAQAAAEPQKEVLGAPPSFDLRTQGYVTPVKDQGSCGSCWAFPTYASLESSILAEGGPERDFSENHLKNYHGFDWGPCYGGNLWLSQAYLSRWSGPVDEADDPYYDYDDRPSPGGPVQYYVRESLILDTDDEIKDALMAYGALYTSMYWSSSYFDSSDNTYYCKRRLQGNHAVTIVGWDDSKPTAARKDGAWLIKNSWGTGWGDSGYFWLAYEDIPGGNYGVTFGDAVEPDSFSTIYYHDEFGDVTEVNSPYAFNAFTAAGDEALKAVQFWTQADGAGYDLSIYDTFSGGTLSDLLGSTTGTLTYGGYHTVDLPSLVPLASGNDFYVYLHITNGGDFPQAIDFEYPGYSSDSTASPGQSYYSFDGTGWTDLTTFDNTANFSIKALTTDDQANAAPFFTSTPVTAATEDTLYSYSVTAGDPDVGDSLTIAAPTLPAWLNLMDNGDGTATLSGTPLNGHVGDNPVTLRVTDALGATDDQSFTVTVAATEVIVAYTLVVTDLGGTELARDGSGNYIVGPGQEFIAEVWVDDPRDVGASGGVFAGYADLLYDVDEMDWVVSGPATPQPQPSIVVDSFFANDQSGTIDEPNRLVDETGGFDGSTAPGADPAQLLFTVHGQIDLTCPDSTIITLSLDPADVSLSHDTLVFGDSNPASASYESEPLHVVQWSWTNSPREDVNDTGTIEPLDALTIINELNNPTMPHVPLPTLVSPPPYFYDVSGDGNLSPIDALIVIDYLNSLETGPLGSSQPESSVVTPGVIPQVVPAAADWGVTRAEAAHAFASDRAVNATRPIGISQGKGGKSATFTPALTLDGRYEVYLWWPDAPIWATDVPVDITHDGGTSTVSVDESTNGGRWNLIGTFDFTAGTGSVTIRTDGTTLHVAANAVRFLRVGDM